MLPNNEPIENLLKECFIAVKSNAPILEITKLNALTISSVGTINDIFNSAFRECKWELAIGVMSMCKGHIDMVKSKTSKGLSAAFDDASEINK